MRQRADLQVGDWLQLPSGPARVTVSDDGRLVRQHFKPVGCEDTAHLDAGGIGPLSGDKALSPPLWGWCKHCMTHGFFRMDAAG